MLKILYAASDSYGSKIQLERFLNAIQDKVQDKQFIIKIAAYKKSSPKNQSIDWTLDSLLNICKPDLFSLDNENFNIYADQIKKYNPDLIISDLEYFTSYIAMSLDISLWQCSSLIMNHAIKDKYDVGLFKNYAYVLNKNPTNTQRVVNILDNSNCNFVYSHFCDIANSPELKNNFEWIRPYHYVGKRYPLCKHNIIATTLMPGINKKIVSLLEKHQDSIIFADSTEEKYSNVLVKDINNYKELACNIFNSNLFVCEGHTSFLADAFYNKKYSIIYPDYKDGECIINTSFSARFLTGDSIHNIKEDLYNCMNEKFENIENPKAKFLHERLEEL